MTVVGGRSASSWGRLDVQEKRRTTEKSEDMIRGQGFVSMNLSMDQTRRRHGCLSLDLGFETVTVLHSM